MKTPALLGLVLGGAIATAASTANAENFPLYPVSEPAPIEQPVRPILPPVQPAPAPPQSRATQQAPPAPEPAREPTILATGFGYSLEVREAEGRRLMLHSLPFTLSRRISSQLTGAVDGSVDIVRRSGEDEDAGYESVRAGPRLDLNFERIDGRVFAYLGRDDLQFERNDRRTVAVDAGADLSVNVSGGLDLSAAVRERYAFPGSVFGFRAGPRYALSDRTALSLGVNHAREGPYDNELTSGFAGLAYRDTGGLTLHVEGMGGQRSGARARLQVPLGRPDIVLDVSGEGYADRDSTNVERGRGMASLIFEL